MSFSNLSWRKFDGVLELYDILKFKLNVYFDSVFNIPKN